MGRRHWLGLNFNTISLIHIKLQVVCLIKIIIVITGSKYLKIFIKRLATSHKRITQNEPKFRPDNVYKINIYCEA